MNNRVPLRSQKPFSHQQEQPEQEQKLTQDFVVPKQQTRTSLQSTNLSNKGFTGALKRSWQTGCFSLLNHGLVTFPDELFNMDKINLDGEQWWSKNTLNKIDLSNNLITLLPSMESLRDVQVLRLDSNKIQSLSDNLFESLPNLKSLSLMKNNLQKFNLYYAPNLVELQLCENQLQEFLSDIQSNQNFLSLEILDLRQNQLINCPNLFTANKLKRLNLQQNKIQALLTTHLKNCVQLEEALFSKNQIAYIDLGVFANMKQLKIIDLKENKLQEFTQDHLGSGHTVIDQILLSYNQLQHYNAFLEMPQLSILLLNNNKIGFLPPTIFQLKNLKTLDISNNDLSDLPSEIALLPYLVRIQLEGNPLKCIRHNVRQSGAEVLKAYLKDRIQDLKIYQQEEPQKVKPKIQDSQINYQQQEQQKMEIEQRQRTPEKINPLERSMIINEINGLDKEILYLENLIQDDFSMNKFQKQEKKKQLSQLLLQRNQLLNRIK